MGKREKRALGAFLGSFGEEYMRGTEQRKAEQRIAKAAWLKCIMEGGKDEDCLSMSGYRPEEDELHGAVSERERRIEVEEAPKRREEATLGQFLEAKRTGKMPEIGEMAPKAFKVYEKHEKFLGSEEEKVLTGEKRWLAENPGKSHEDYVKKMRELGQYGQELSPAFMATHEPDPLKPGKMRPLGKSVQERTKEWREKKKTHLKDVTKYVMQFHKDWRKAKEAYVPDSEDKKTYWKSWKDGIPPEFQYDVGVKLGVKEAFLGKPKEGKPVSVPQTQKEIYNQCRAGGGGIEECKVKAGIE